MKRAQWERSRSYGHVADALGFDPVGMRWVDLNCDLLWKIDVSERALAEGTGRRKVLDETEDATLKVVDALAHAVIDTARELSKGLSSGETPGNRDRNHDRLLPWLPSENRELYYQRLANEGFLSKAVNPRSRLPGQSRQRLGEVVGVVKLVPTSGLRSYRPFSSPDDLRFGIPLVVIEIDCVSFWDGSVFGWLRGKVKVLVLALPLLSVPPIPDLVKDAVDHGRFHARVNQALKDQPIVKLRSFKFPESELRAHGANLLNYKERGLTPGERRRRVAVVQLALRLALRTGIVIDGKEGRETAEHLRQFAKSKDSPNGIENEFLRAELFKVLTPETLMPW